MRLTTKLVLSFAGIIALLLLMSGVSFKSVSGMNASVTSVDTDIMPSVVAVQGMQVNFWSIRSNLSAMLLARDVSRVGEYEKRMTDILAQIKKGVNPSWIPWTPSPRRKRPMPKPCWTKSTPRPTKWALRAKS